jgi:hypothetical protein
MLCRANSEEDGNSTECNFDFTFFKRPFIINVKSKKTYTQGKRIYVTTGSNYTKLMFCYIKNVIQVWGQH